MQNEVIIFKRVPKFYFSFRKERLFLERGDSLSTILPLFLFEREWKESV